VSRTSWFKALALAAALIGFQGVGTAKAQDWTNYLHWPYAPPQAQGNGFSNTALYDGFYTYPREQRIVPQIQGPYYRNYYSGQRVFGIRHYFDRGNDFRGGDWSNKRYYSGYHFFLDVF
jgi:hypothetical protein